MLKDLFKLSVKYQIEKWNLLLIGFSAILITYMSLMIMGETLRAPLMDFNPNLLIPALLFLGAMIFLRERRSETHSIDKNMMTTSEIIIGGIGGIICAICVYNSVRIVGDMLVPASVIAGSLSFIVLLSILRNL